MEFCSHQMQTLKKKVKGDDAAFEAPMSLLEMVKAPGVAYVLFLYTHVMLLGLAYTAGMSITLFELQPIFGPRS